VYIAGLVNETDRVIGKYLISGETAQELMYVSYVSLGLEDVGYSLDVADMTVKDGKLYIAAGESEVADRGKIVEVRLSDLAKLREIGWCSAGTPSAAETYFFYGPQRFVGIVPHKLILADEGYDAGENEINRIVEVDLGGWTFSAIRMESTAALFN